MLDSPSSSLRQHRRRRRAKDDDDNASCDDAPSFSASSVILPAAAPPSKRNPSSEDSSHDDHDGFYEASAGSYLDKPVADDQNIGNPHLPGSSASLTETEMCSRLMSSLLSKGTDLPTLLTAMQDCYGRFILNLPREYLTNHIHLCFAIQESYWWYDDFWHEKLPKQLPKLSMQNFGFLLCELCPLLRLYFNADAYSKFLVHWRRYCRTIPLKGAILLNDSLTKVLMVQGWRGDCWHFPRGKVDEQEEDTVCAIREIKEEVGVDISRMINPHIFIEMNLDEQPLKLYVVPGVLESTPFNPRKRKEIGRIRWIPVDQLPGWSSQWSRKLAGAKAFRKLQKNKKLEEKRHHFWQVVPFVPALAGWLALFESGAKAFQPSLRANPVDLLCNWHPAANEEVWPFGFPAPPTGYNDALTLRYTSAIQEATFSDLTNAKLAKHPDEKVALEFYRKQPARPYVGQNDPTASKPAAAKTSALPPLVAENRMYQVPPSTSRKFIASLQRPGRLIAETHSPISGAPNNMPVAQPLPSGQALLQVLRGNSGTQVGSNAGDLYSHAGDLYSHAGDLYTHAGSRSILRDLHSQLGLDVSPPVAERNQRDDSLLFDEPATLSASGKIVRDLLDKQVPADASGEKRNASNEPSDRSQVSRNIKEILRLARLSFETINACRERLGKGQISMETFTQLLGLTET